MEGFTSFSVDTAYVLYEVRCNEFSYVVKTLNSANRIKKTLQGYGAVRAYKRIGFLHKGVIFCTNGRSYPIININSNEEKHESDVMQLFLSSTV